jgi:hypothetical protein
MVSAGTLSNARVIVQWGRLNLPDEGIRWPRASRPELGRPGHPSRSIALASGGPLAKEPRCRRYN